MMSLQIGLIDIDLRLWAVSLANNTALTAPSASVTLAKEVNLKRLFISFYHIMFCFMNVVIGKMWLFVLNIHWAPFWSKPKRKLASVYPVITWINIELKLSELKCYQGWVSSWHLPIWEMCKMSCFVASEWSCLDWSFKSDCLLPQQRITNSATSIAITKMYLCMWTVLC